MKSKTFVVLGGSPNVPDIDKLHDWVLDNNAKVIGLNTAAIRHSAGWLMDYWLVWDTPDMHNLPDMVWQYQNLNHCTYVFRDTPEAKAKYRRAGIRWYKDGELRCAFTSATTACDFARSEGATEIYLVGVDLCQTSKGWDQERLDTALPIVNQFFTDYPVPVYKTTERSPLALEYRSL